MYAPSLKHKKITTKHPYKSRLLLPKRKRKRKEPRGRYMSETPLSPPNGKVFTVFDFMRSTARRI